MKVATQFAVEPMRVEHIPAVSGIERESFPQPWPQSAYRREIEENRSAHYMVAKLVGDSQLDGYGDSNLPPALPGEGLFDRITRFLRTSAPPPPDPTLEAELRSIVGYAGLWLMTDEAHVTTIASHPQFRGKGVGELLLLGLIERSLAIGARWLTLEVRVTNSVAQNLYRKYTFKEMGTRRRYYSDNNEDALVMWTDALDSEPFLEALDRNERQLAERMGAEIRLGPAARMLGNG
jgi:ribosomal-protein-alanine N-acetyltransferase